MGEGENEECIQRGKLWGEDHVVQKEFMNRLVMNYLVVEGYKEEAEKLSEETGSELATASGIVDFAVLGERRDARVAIQNGNVQEAIDRVNKIDPKIITENPKLHFHLLQQKLIELIRQGEVSEAIDFAQTELGPRSAEHPEFLAELQKTLTLLVFGEKAKGSIEDLLSSSQRQKTASELNAALLASRNESNSPVLPRLLKLMLWAQDQLVRKGLRLEKTPEAMLCL